MTLFGDDYPTPDGTCIRDYIHVSDLAEAHVLAVEYLLRGGESDVFNVGTGYGHSVKEMLESVERVTGRKVPHNIGPRREGDPPRLVANSDKLQQKLNWRPTRPIWIALLATRGRSSSASLKSSQVSVPVAARRLVSSLISQYASYRKGLQQASREMMPLAQEFRCVVAYPHMLVSILPDENLQRQVDGDSRCGFHQRRSAFGIAKDNKLSCLASATRPSPLRRYDPQRQRRELPCFRAAPPAGRASRRRSARWRWLLDPRSGSLGLMPLAERMSGIRRRVRLHAHVSSYEQRINVPAICRVSSGEHFSNQNALVQRVHTQRPLCFVRGDGRLLLQNVAEFVDAFQHAILRKLINGKRHRRTIRQR